LHGQCFCLLVPQADFGQGTGDQFGRGSDDRIQRLLQIEAGVDAAGELVEDAQRMVEIPDPFPSGDCGFPHPGFRAFSDARTAGMCYNKAVLARSFQIGRSGTGGAGR
jgi:hypothetical protein